MNIKNRHVVSFCDVNANVFDGLNRIAVLNIAMCFTCFGKQRQIRKNPVVIDYNVLIFNFQRYRSTVILCRATTIQRVTIACDCVSQHSIQITFHD